MEGGECFILILFIQLFHEEVVSATNQRRTATWRVAKDSSKSEMEEETMVQVASSNQSPSISSAKVTAVFLRKPRCVDWWCIEDKGRNITLSTLSELHTVPVTTTTTISNNGSAFYNKSVLHVYSVVVLFTASFNVHFSAMYLSRYPV